MSDYTNPGYRTDTGAYAGGNLVSAVFNDGNDAQRAVDWLRDNGVSESAISVVARRSDDYDRMGDTAHDTDEAADQAAEAGRGALAGAGVGAGVGALFGLAAAAIPGIGPFITAGALTAALGVTGGAAASGAIVGGSSGALAGALSRWGMSSEESTHYAGQVERGGTYVGVDLARTNLDRQSVIDAFRRFNGSTYNT